jgi:hypothetical protein
MQLRSQSVQLNSENMQLKGENTQLKSDSSQLKSDNSQLESHLVQLKSEISQVKSENSRPKSASSQLKSENTQLKSENRQRKSENAQLKLENTQLKGENSEFHSQNAQLKLENFQMKSEITQLKSANSQANWENSQLQAEASQLRSLAAGRESENAVLKTENARLKAKSAVSAKQIAPVPVPLPAAARPQAGTLLAQSQAKMLSCHVSLANAQLLMNVKAGRFDMEEFVTKIVKPGLKPMLLLLEWKPGFVIGGFAAVAWPKREGFGTCTSDPEKKSFIFSLEPKARRFDLLEAEKALQRVADRRFRGFYFGKDLGVFDDGTCWSGSDYHYAGGRDDGSFPDGEAAFTRFELWSL